MASKKQIEIKRAYSCTRKTKYRSRRHAEKVETLRMVNAGWSKGTIYKCEFCNHYHISSRKSLNPIERIELLLRER